MKIFVALLTLSLTSITAAAGTLQYLEEKTAYCYSADSLAKYLRMAQVRNIEGMNQLVFKGECNFVPDGEVFSLADYRKDAIGNMPVIAFEKDQQTLWTFKALVSTSTIDKL